MPTAQKNSINSSTHQWAQSQNLSCFYFPEITSTNDVAKIEFPKQRTEFALYLADDQRQGRGRNQNTWQNLAAGEILLSTWCFKTQKAPQPILTPLLGLALYQSLKHIDNNLPLRLKAPNDLYLNNGKLSGLLVEVSQVGTDFFIYIGLGLNVFNSPQANLKTAHLSQHINVDTSIWDQFCHKLQPAFKQAVNKGEASELSSQDQFDLLNALNANLPQPEQYTKISPNCDLYTATGVISWMDL